LTTLVGKQLSLHLQNSSSRRRDRKFSAYRHIESLLQLVVTGFDVPFSLA
jgi:hypothetical protein